MTTASESNELLMLRDPKTIRARCENVFEAGVRGELAHFTVDLSRLKAAARYTADVTRERYPNLVVPEHGRMTHFDTCGVSRSAQLLAALAQYDRMEQARLLIDVILFSVLLDAGAGTDWHFVEPGTNLRLGRSEGLAVASLTWARSGALSSRARAFEVDAAGLCAIDEPAFARAFQLRRDNPLVGVAGRLHLLQALGRALTEHEAVFGKAGRPGGLIDHWVAHAHGGPISAPFILGTLLAQLGAIWPGRLELEGVPLGDVWRHPAAGGEGPSAGLVPFHKLSQWLTYSLLHPLRVAGQTVRDVELLTGLAEYRNGGLFVDMHVLAPKHRAVTTDAHEVGSELVVEWRALTIALLDRLAPLVRVELGMRERDERLPLVSVLEGGSWAAGRRLAAVRCRRALPPISVISDGTVF
jgi:Protein of unknown function (DUF1688)